MKEIASSPQIYLLLKRFQEDPSSRVFAPLAEAYRKSGFAEEAVSVAREGLKFHPNFISGRVALARALYDLQRYSEVVEEMRPVLREVPDNIIAQRLFAESCLMTGLVLEALSAYKMLLFFQPQDAELAGIVQELETKAYQDGSLVLRQDAPEESAAFSIMSAQDVLPGDAEPANVRDRWIRQIEGLQDLLQKVERYRVAPVSETR